MRLGLGLCIPFAIACGDLPPLGEALVIVDTDAPLEVAGRLRVDVYAADGTWLHSRDLLTSDARDWPVSFSVQASDELESQALVRLRAHPAGRLRDYVGERYAEAVAWSPQPAPRSVAAMCDQPAVVEAGGIATVRLGPDSFVPLESWCQTASFPAEVQAYGGSNAIALDIDEADTYRISVIATNPSPEPPRLVKTQVLLHLQPACDVPVSDGEPCAGPHFESLASTPTIERPLEPGRYHILLGALEIAPMDVTIGVAKASEWEDLLVELPALLSPESVEPEGPLAPIYGAAPLSEPAPSTTIDRLLLLDLTPGRVGAAHVTLHAACIGAMARLKETWPHQPPVIEEALTCTNVEGELEPLEPHPLGDDLTVPAASTALDSAVAHEDCDQPDDDDRVCVPGGLVFLGDPTLLGSGAIDLAPERVAFVSRFWIDRRQVSNGDYRAALAAGYVPTALPLEGTPDAPCTWTAMADPAGDERPLNCVRWQEARAFCQHRGGDLPTAAQWEYAATRAGRAASSLFPWGDDIPRCRVSDCSEPPCHAIDAGQPNGCIPLSDTPGPLPATDFHDPIFGDVSVPLNDDPGSLVYGLGGGVAEMTRDALHDFESPCWRAATLTDPICGEPDAILRERRGGHWASRGAATLAASRAATFTGANLASSLFQPGPFLADDASGFRCVYVEVTP